MWRVQQKRILPDLLYAMVLAMRRVQHERIFPDMLYAMALAARLRVSDGLRIIPEPIAPFLDACLYQRFALRTFAVVQE